MSISTATRHPLHRNSADKPTTDGFRPVGNRRQMARLGERHARNHRHYYLHCHTTCHPATITTCRVKASFSRRKLEIGTEIRPNANYESGGRKWLFVVRDSHDVFSKKLLEFIRNFGDSYRHLLTTPGDATMSPILRRLTALAAAFLPALAFAQPPDLAEYKTVEQAVAAKEMKDRTAASAQPGFLGIYAEERDGKVIAGEVATDSPAARAGLKRGEVLLAVDGKSLDGAQSFREAVAGKGPGASVKLGVQRDGKTAEVTATLAAPSRPQKPGAPRAVLGIDVEPRKEGDGVVIRQISANSPAERARLKVDEVLLKFDGTDVASSDKLKELIAAKKPDDSITLTLLIADKQVEMKVTLGAVGGGGGGAGRRGGGGGGGGGMGPGGAGWDARGMQYWKKDAYKLAIVLIEYPDVKCNPKVPVTAWQDAMFSKASFKKTATGETAYGSLFDYYLEQSYGHLKVSGKAFAPVQVSKKRAEYGTPGTNRMALLTEALDKITARDGKDALKEFDGVIFIYAGGRMQVARGSLYWPHRSSVSYQGKRWPYFICGEGG